MFFCVKGEVQLKPVYVWPVTLALAWCQLSSPEPYNCVSVYCISCVCVCMSVSVWANIVLREMCVCVHEFPEGEAP